MASPHAVGVAALIVAEYGKRDKRNGGADAAIPTRSSGSSSGPRPTTPARPAACRPTPACRRRPGVHGDLRGPPQRNGFYGDGIVDALGAVSGRR